MKQRLETRLYYNLLLSVFNIWETYAKEQISLYEETSLTDITHPNLHRENLATLKHIADMIHIVKKFLISIEHMAKEGGFASVDALNSHILKEIKKLFDEYALPDMMFPLAEKKISEILEFYHKFVDEITILPPSLSEGGKK